MDQPDHVELNKTAGKLSVRTPRNGRYLAYLRSLVADLARQVGFADDEVAKIEMAVDEACSNVLKHAYAGQQDIPIPKKTWQWKRRDPGLRLDVCAEANRLTIEINDHGQRFDFDNYRPKNMEERIRQMETGGYGISIMHQFMDRVEYTSSATAGNTLRLVKYLKKT
jgi:serine/threonine-protein kinase RsbW